MKPLLQQVAADDSAIQVRNLSVEFGRGSGAVRAVNGIDFDLRRGEVLGIVGESGSGKSVMLRSLMGLLPERARVEGNVSLLGREVVGLGRGAWGELRGPVIAMIFQEPMTAFDPVYTIGAQIVETIMCHMRCSHATAERRALELMDLVAIPSARNRLANYPHELSGGMRQRAMIAMALACNPRILLADEPTTALDVTVQIQILLMLRRLQAELDMSVVFVTHDIGVATEVSDHIAVMYAGRFVERGPTEILIGESLHPYAQGLLASTLRGQRRGTPLETIAGAPPNLAALPVGCAFAPRCKHMDSALCMGDRPGLRAAQPGHLVECVRVPHFSSCAPGGTT
ncbi:ABC transporter ATP-binding protein [Variovorax sp. J31P207]|uniref:ABC transporter ATP-binding protein n=1 Tax=Variovorax sp. J31P207 TaxID=3053510 RepID=UPI002574A8D0|nr:ABC transporter ATP-binding protein [Variovorax sp. J31P207]MDM0069942.1 ABC transporter ATP-binding protein [Variovorax sp. J31P207]